MNNSYKGELSKLIGDLAAKGRREAEAHRPPSDATSPDQHEASVRIQAEKWLGDEQQIFNMQVATATSAIQEIKQKGIALEVRSQQLCSDTTLSSTIDADLAGERKALVDATKRRIERLVELRGFREHNSITEQAVYPDSRIWHFAIVAVFALIETAINSVFFQNSQGLLGGFSVALGVSVVNMGAAMALGAGFRYKNITDLDKRILGWSCLALFLLVAIYCNAIFSTFRSEYVMITDPGDANQLRLAFANSMAEAKKVFILDMAIADFESFILFGLGILLSLLAFWKGYTYDDRYPSHGDKDRAYKKSLRDEQEMQVSLSDKLKSDFQRRRAEVNATINEAAQLIGSASNQSVSLSGAVATLKVQAQAIQRDYALAINSYRRANLDVRGTSAPEYFSRTDDLTSRVNADSAENVISDLEATQKYIGDIRDRIQEPLSKKLQELQGDGAAVLTKQYPEFLKEVEAEAQQLIDRMAPTLGRGSK
jgi:hypothetical protein